MEQNKYYTPDISEFYVGFVYERLFTRDDYDFSFVNKQQVTGKWEKFTCDLFNLYHINSLLISSDNGFENRVRVKYLDKEDIESLGFHQHENEYWLYQDNGIIILTIIEDTYISIYEEYGPGYNNILFKGIIKNKSELKVLLKQLGVNE